MQLRFDQYVSLTLLCGALLLSGLSQPISASQEPGSVFLLEKPEITIPITDSTVAEPEITATSAIVIDEQSAVTLFDKNSQQQFSPASTTKLMTALVARSIFELDMALSVPSIVSALDGTRMGLVPGERLSVQALLKGALMQSGNDAAITLASAHPAGIDGFILDMNLLAKIYHLDHTSFKNPIGYDAPENFSTARDLALLAR